MIPSRRMCPAAGMALHMPQHVRVCMGSCRVHNRHVIDCRGHGGAIDRVASAGQHVRMPRCPLAQAAFASSRPAAAVARAAAPAASASAAAGTEEDSELLRSDPDRYYMRRALRLAERGVGHTHPNPAVGSVIVRKGEVVGEGYHPKAGMPHAEVYALRGAGQRARGATAYVTLEPCAHYGRTPPCANALVEAGVARVVVGVVDPNPLVGGAGIKILTDAGIEVVAGLEEDSCYAINREFMERMAAQAEEQSAS